MAMGDEGELRIGEVLKSTRTRLRLDIATAEERTKIRTKYLRALENEEWDTLPGPTYVKGFLRTYASYLGLDADALVDEYRRTVERSPAIEQPYLFSEPLLERRRRPVEPRRRSRGSWLVVAASVGALAAIVLVAIGLFGGSSDNEGKGHNRGKHDRHHHGSQGLKQGGQGNGGSSGKPVSLALTTHDEMIVCLLPGHGRPLIDSQTLVAGSKEGPFEPAAENYRLDLISGGAVTVILGGKPQRVRSKRPASFEIDAGGIRQIAYQGQKCP